LSRQHSGAAPPAAALSLWQTLRTVGWSFFGVRRRQGHEQDMAHLNPVHLVLGGVLGAVVFVMILVALVKWVVGSGIAA
jgi:hypothetical protein